MEHTFEDNLKISEVAVIGSAASERHQIAEDPSGHFYVTISVRQVLKGRVRPQIELLVTPDDVEFDPRCCVLDGMYILLLKKIDSNRYATVNGHFGAYEIR